MEQIKQLEKNIESWLKPVPHLPMTWRKWLAENMWWLTAVGVVFSVMAVLGLYQAATFVSTYDKLAEMYSPFVNYSNQFSGGWSLYIVVSMVALATMVVLMAKSINPLKAMNKKGWDLTFIATLVSAALSIFSVVFNSNSNSLVASLVGIFISVYVLFELRTFYKEPVKK